MAVLLLCVFIRTCSHNCVTQSSETEKNEIKKTYAKQFGEIILIIYQLLIKTHTYDTKQLTVYLHLNA